MSCDVYPAPMGSRPPAVPFGRAGDGPRHPGGQLPPPRLPRQGQGRLRLRRRPHRLSPSPPLCTGASEGGLQDGRVLVAAVLRRRIHLAELTGGREFMDIPPVPQSSLSLPDLHEGLVKWAVVQHDLAFPESVRAVAWCGRQLGVAVRDEYWLVKVLPINVPPVSSDSAHRPRSAHPIECGLVHDAVCDCEPVGLRGLRHVQCNSSRTPQSHWLCS